jgi:hypothetical protein
MMKDILQYLPYALFATAILLMLLIGVAITVRFFRKSNRRTAKR